LLYSRNYQNIVKQLYSNKKIIKKKFLIKEKSLETQDQRNKELSKKPSEYLHKDKKSIPSEIGNEKIMSTCGSTNFQ